jgi:putative transposase
MFADEAGFGRINEPAYCWVPPKKRPSVPCLRIREYKTVYGAICPETGDAFFQVMNGNNKENMSAFLKALSEKFPDEIILLVLDNAGWHMTQQENSKRRSKNSSPNTKFITTDKLIRPDHIRLAYLPPRTPEMNPIEIIWREIRKLGFKNVIFSLLDKVIQKFYEVVSNLSNDVVISVTFWDWIKAIIYQGF